MPAAFILSFAQLWDPAIRRILLRALLLTLLLFAGLSWAVFKGIAMIETNGWPQWLQSFWTNGAGDAAAFLPKAFVDANFLLKQFIDLELR